MILSSKRRREIDININEQPNRLKRHRLNHSPATTVDTSANTAPILRLSDELFLRICSHLQAHDLASFQRVNQRCQRIAVDGQIWKALYYQKYVRPRALRIPGGQVKLDYFSRASWWLEGEGISQGKEVGMDWKRLYRLRHKWGIGSCVARKVVDVDGYDEVENIMTHMAQSPGQRESLVKLHEGIVFTASSKHGLRAWRIRDTDELIAHFSLYSTSFPFSRVGIPTALAVHEKTIGSYGDDAAELTNVTIGFNNGSFAVYQLDSLGEASIFRLVFIRALQEPTTTITAAAANATTITDNTTRTTAAGSKKIIAMVAFGPYLSLMTEGQIWEIYDFSASASDENLQGPGAGSNGTMIHDSAGATTSGSSRSRMAPPPAAMLGPPKLLATHRSSTAWPPVTLSLRRSVNSTLVASIAYASPLYTSGWSIAMQELRFTILATKAVLRDSRIACSAPQGFRPVEGGRTATGSGSGSGVAGVSSANTGRAVGSQLDGDPSLARPTSMSYCHPYLVASYANNTLTVHLVRSTETLFTIDSGCRLWGHTSAVNAVQVDGRGKAVSVSGKSGEMRVWKLEGGGVGVASGTGLRRRCNSTGGWDGSGVRIEAQGVGSENAGSIRALGGFDDAKVVVLKNELVVYDFSR